MKTCSCCAEWASEDRTNVASWNYGVIGGNTTQQKRSPQHVLSSPGKPLAARNSSASSGGIAYHLFHRQTQELFTENTDKRGQAEWGDWIYATEQVSGLTYSNGASDVDTRGAFISSGSLENVQNTDYRAINSDYPVFAFSIDYGSISSTPQSSLFTITIAQEQAIQFESGTGDIQSLPPLWTSYFSDELALVSFFYNDYSNAQTTAAALDEQVSSDSIAAGGDNYNIITSLSVRQAFGATQLVGNETNYYLFLKEISSDSDIQTVDVIFPSMPIFLYFNPDLLKNLLDPIFIYTEAGLFGEQYALHDLGYVSVIITIREDGNLQDLQYPNATSAGTEVQQLEESGNMVIMTLAYAQRTGDTAYLSDHYDTLTGWASYLVNDSLIPSNQISTDDFAGSLA